MHNTNPYDAPYHGDLAAVAAESDRVQFIQRTYSHLAGAVSVFVALEIALFTFVPEDTMRAIVGQLFRGYNWLILLGGFLLVGWMAQAWASSGRSRGLQYAGLGLYVVAEAAIMFPLLYIAMRMDQNLPAMAGVLTAVSFAGMTTFVFVTRADLHWMGKYLFLAGLVAIGLIICGVLFGFSLGVWFSAAMVGLACGCILYDTSNVLHHYRTDQHVAASLALFASVALLFWYVLRLMMAFGSSD